MKHLRTFLSRLWALARSRQMERDLDEEVASHLAEATDEFIQQGLSPEEAHRAALRSFGGVTQAKEVHRQVRSFGWLDDLRHDVRYTIRTLARNPVFTGVVVLTLALGIGANTTIFSVVNSLLLRQLPVQEPERLAILGGAAGQAVSWSDPVWQQIRQGPELFEGAFAASPARLNLARGGEAQFVNGLWVSGEFFDVLGVQPVLGRTFTLDDDRRGGGPDGPVAVISHDFWQRRFGGTPSALGQTLQLDSVAFTIIGVTPPAFFGTNVGRRFDVAIPIGTEPLLRGIDTSLGLATRNWLEIMVRLRGDQTLDQATGALQRIQSQIRDAVSPSLPEGLRAVVLKDPFALTSAAEGMSTLRERYSLALVVLLILVGFVLLIACVNIANLLLARAVTRRPEMSVRIAIGASRSRIARMLLAEVSILAVMGAAAGVGLSIWLRQLLVQQLSTSDNIVFLDLTLDWRVLLFTAMVATATALLFGAAPAWYSTRADPASTLVEHGRGPATGGRSPLTAALVGAQLALSLVLVVGASLFIRTFTALASQDLGFTRNRVLVVDVTAPMTRYTVPQLAGVYERVREAVAAVPGVERAALSDITPVGGSSRNGFVEVAGAEALPQDERLIMVNVVGPGWFATYDTRLLGGRDFAVTDRPGTLPVAVVNEAFARRFLKDASPIGRAVTLGGGNDKSRFEIVGLVEDAVYRSVREPAPPTIYTSTTQRADARPRAKISVLSATESPALLSRGLVAAVRGVDPELTLQLRPLAEQVDAAMNQERLVAWLSAVFGVLALLLAGIGLYGVTAYAASRRRAEIGIRLALGADRSGVIRLVMGRVAWPIVGGLVVGAGLSLWLARFVDTLVWGMAPRDPFAFVSAASILAAVGALAAWLPAWHASRQNPVAALRQ